MIQNMRKILFLITFLSIANLQAQNREILFQNVSWSQAVRLAAKEKKMIFLDAYTSWCGPCKWMVANVFNRDSVATLFNASFVNIKVDMEKGEGPDLKKLFRIQAYPTYLFFSSEGKEVHRIVGSMSLQAFLSEANKAQSPQDSYRSLADRFSSGDRSLGFIQRYFGALEAANETDSLSTISAIYFDGLKASELMSDDNWDLIRRYLTNPASESFKWLFEHQQELKRMYPHSDVDAYFRTTFVRTANRVRLAYKRAGSIEDVLHQKDAMLSLLSTPTLLSYAQSLLFELKTLDLARKKKWVEYIQFVSASITDTALQMRPAQVNAVNDLVNESSVSLLPQALIWIAKLRQNTSDTFINIQLLDIESRILKKQGKNDEAGRKQEQALNMRKDASLRGQITPPIMKN